MADIEKEVLLRVKLDPSELEKRGDVLEKSLQGVKDQIAGVNKELRNKNIGGPERDKLLAQLRQLQKEQGEWKKQISSNNKEIEFQTKLTNAQEGSNEQLRLQLSALTKVYNGLSKEARENSAEGNQLKDTIKGLSDTLKENESAVGDNRRNVGNYKETLEDVLAPLIKQKEALQAQTESLKQNVQSQDQAIKKTIGFGTGIKTFNASLGETESSFEAVNKQIIANEQAIVSLDQEIEKVSIGFNNADGTIKGITTTQKQYENTLDGMTEKLKDLRELAPTLDLNSEEFKSTNEEIRKTSFEIDKAIGKVDEFGNREPKNPAKEAMEDTFEAASALTGSIGLLTIAFGKNETIQEIQEKTLKAVAIAQTLANIAKSKGAIVNIIDIAQTKAKTAAQLIQNVVIGAGTAGLKAFRIALATTGIGILIVGIILLATKTDALNVILGKTSKEAKRLKEAQDSLDKATKSVIENTSKEVSQYFILTQKLKDGNLTYKEKKAIVDTLNSQYGTTIKNLNDEKDIAEQVAKAYGQIISKIRDKIILENSEERLKPIIEERIQLELNLKQALANQKQYETINENLKKSKEFQKGTNQSLLDTVKENEKLIKDNAQQVTVSQLLLTDNQDKINLILKETGVDLLNISSITTTTQNKTTKQTQDNMQAILDFEKKIAEESQDVFVDSLADLEKKETDQLKLSQERKKQQLLEAFNNLKATNQKEIDEKKKAEEQLQVFLTQIDEETLSKQLDIREKFRLIEEAEQMGIAKARLDRQTIELAKTKESRRLDIEENIKDEKQKAIALIQLEIDTQKEILRIHQETANLDLFISPEEQDNIDDANLKLRELEIQLKKINESPLQIIPQSFANDFKVVTDAVQSIVQNFADAMNAGFASATAQVEALGASQVKSIEKSALTEKQKQKQIEKSNLETAKKKYALDVDAFNFNKGTKIAETLIGTAAAVVNAFATAPFPISIVQAALAGITGAVQVGIIAGTQPPPPPFYKGGYTGRGNPREVSNALGEKDYQYHKDEYVIDHQTLKVPSINKFVKGVIEPTRLGKVGSLGLAGFADGGFTASESRTGVRASLATAQLAGQISDALANVQIVTRVTDINRVNKNLIQNKAAATLR